MYYLINRYYDPETGRFLSADDVSYLDPETIGGLNLYAYCNNNPVMNIDPEGNSIIALLAILGAFTLVGGIIGGKVSHDKAVEEGKTGSDLVWSTIGGAFAGAAFGLAAGGATVMLGGVGAGALSVLGIGSGTFFGVSSLQAYAIGAIAFDFTAFVVAPILGIEMQGVEYEPAPSKTMNPAITSPHPSIKKNRHYNTFLKNDNVLNAIFI